MQTSFNRTLWLDVTQPKLAWTFATEHMEGPQLLAGGGDLLIPDHAKPARARQAGHRQTRARHTRPVSALRAGLSVTFRASSTWAKPQAVLCQVAPRGDEPMLRDTVMDMGGGGRETSWRLWPRLLVCQMPHTYSWPHTHRRLFFVWTNTSKYYICFHVFFPFVWTFPDISANKAATSFPRARGT